MGIRDMSVEAEHGLPLIPNSPSAASFGLSDSIDEKAMLATGANHTVDNVVFHDAIFRTEGTHMECLYAIGVPGFTLRNAIGPRVATPVVRVTARAAGATGGEDRSAERAAGGLEFPRA